MPTLSFWGAAGTVTGSKYLIETDRAGVLIDCGLFQGGHELRDRNWQEPPFDAASLKAIIITHAHIDHDHDADHPHRRHLFLYPGPYHGW